VVLLLVGLAGPAAASPETLKRSFSNMLFGPADLVLIPVVAAQNTYNNLQNVDDTMGVRIAYALPGFGWNMGIQAGAGVVRVIAGVFELLPGIGLFFFETDLDPLFAPAERASALVDYDTPVLRIKFGITYTE
jgi:hypothetical protein